MPSLAHRRRMTRRIVGGVALVGLLGYVFVVYSEMQVARSHAWRDETYRRIGATHRAANP